MAVAVNGTSGVAKRVASRVKHPAPLDAKEPDPLDLKEWDRCRSTIVDYDKIVSDLRKYGFTIVTGLLSVGAFVATATETGGQLPNAAKAGIAGVIAILVTALFFVDRYYVVQQSGASRRAVHIERENWARFALKWASACSSGAGPSTLISSEPPFPDNPDGDAAKYLSEVLNRYATQSFSLYVALALYLTLVTAALGLGMVIIKVQRAPDVSIGQAFADRLGDVARLSTYTDLRTGTGDSIGKALLGVFLLCIAISLLVAGAFFAAGFVHRIHEAFGGRTPESAGKASQKARFAAFLALISIFVALVILPVSLFYDLVLSDHALVALGTIYAMSVAAILGYFVLTERQFETALRRGGRYFQKREESVANARELFTSARNSIRAIWSYANYDDLDQNQTYFAETLRWAASNEVRVTRLIDIDSLDLDAVVRHLWEARNDIGEFYEPKLVHRTGFEMIIADQQRAALYFHIGQPPGKTSASTPNDGVSLWELYSAPMQVSLIGEMFDEKAKHARELDVQLLRELSAVKRDDHRARDKMQAKLRNWIISEMLSPKPDRKKEVPAYFFAYGTELDPRLLADIKLPVYNRFAATWEGVKLVFRKQRFRDDEEGCATTEKFEGGTIRGVAYEIDEASVAYLERFIGVPGHYVRRKTRITLDSGWEVEAYAYESADHWLKDASAGLKPSRDNMYHMLTARDLLDDDYVKSLETVRDTCALDNTPLPFTRAITKLVGVINDGIWTGPIESLRADIETLYRRRTREQDEPVLKNARILRQQLNRHSAALRNSGYCVELVCCGRVVRGWCLHRHRAQRVKIVPVPTPHASATTPRPLL